MASPRSLDYLLDPLRKLVSYQAKIQQAVEAKFLPQGVNGEGGSLNVSGKWLPIHLGVNMLDNIIEEAVEAKRLIRMRKWWTRDVDLEVNYQQLQDPKSDLRGELVQELADILVQFLNCLGYLGVSPEEFLAHLAAKMALNDPTSTESTLGDRS